MSVYFMLHANQFSSEVFKMLFATSYLKKQLLIECNLVWKTILKIRNQKEKSKHLNILQLHQHDNNYQKNIRRQKRK